MFGLCWAFPTGEQPFLSIKITRPDGGFDSTVSKSEVNMKETGAAGDFNKNEPFHPHVPPFLAFRKDYQPLPAAPQPYNSAR